MARVCKYTYGGFLDPGRACHGLCNETSMYAPTAEHQHKHRHWLIRCRFPVVGCFCFPGCPLFRFHISMSLSSECFHEFHCYSRIYDLFSRAFLFSVVLSPLNVSRCPIVPFSRVHSHVLLLPCFRFPAVLLFHFLVFLFPHYPISTFHFSQIPPFPFSGFCSWNRDRDPNNQEST